jgi:CRISPR-associated protein Cas1
VDQGRLEVDGHSLMLSRKNDRVEIPPATFAALLLEPGTSITHEAVKLCAENRTALLWVGEAGTRLYAAALPHAHPERLLKQALIHSDLKRRIDAAQRLYGLMFGEPARPSYTLEKLRGHEGAKVRAIYEDLARQHQIEWSGRSEKDDLQQSISFASSCLYALSEIAILLLGYSPAIGVVHSGDSRSFVYDLADTVKFSHLVPTVFQWRKEGHDPSFQAVRKLCRDLFKEKDLLNRLIENADKIIYGLCDNLA